MTNIRHASASPKWGTNPIMISIAQSVLRFCRTPNLSAIEVDPFSEDEFNRDVRAERILTGEPGRDGFVDRWVDGGPRADHILAKYPVELSRDRTANHTALVNAPGDESGDNVKRAWKLLDVHHSTRWIDSGVYVGFSLNQLQTLQGESERDPLHPDFVGCRCIPDYRVPFVAHSTKPKTKTDKKGKTVDVDDAPSHPSFFMFLPHWDPIVATAQRDAWRDLAGALGRVF